MHLVDFQREFVKRADRIGLEYDIWTAATDEHIRETERRLDVVFHEQIRRFYSFCNGFVTHDPHFEVHGLDELEFIKPHLIHFCTVDHCHYLCFDTWALNKAGQWFVVNSETGFRVTYTMASIWTNKVWAWIDRGRTVWNML